MFLEKITSLKTEKKTVFMVL